MNRYDEKYEFRLAKIDDIDQIMEFIREYWGAEHILAHDKEVFLWQYGNTEYGNNEDINVVMMLSKEMGDLLGMIGFIPYSSDCRHISTAITKVRSEGVIPMSGIELMKRQVEFVGEEINFASGTNPDTILPIFKNVFHHTVGVMEQYYMLNPKFSEFKVAKIVDRENVQPAQTGYTLQFFENIDDAEDFDFNKYFEHMSIKSKEFIEKRYFNHPVYKYMKWEVLDSNKETVGLLFGREVNVEGTVVLRIVDYRGDLTDLYNAGIAIQHLFESNGYEYIDLMVDLLSCQDMRKAGFSLLNPDGENIIPNYFEPFLRKNIKNYYQKNGDVVIFKADGDQDRPNRR